jgi:hypothetical protein
METTFDVVAVCQCRENCGDTENPHWKARGGEERVVKSHLTISEASKLTNDDLWKIAKDSEIEYANEYYEMELIDVELVAIGRELIEQVEPILIEKENDPYKDDNDYIAYSIAHKINVPEYAVKWAMVQLGRKVSGDDYMREIAHLTED